MNCIYALLNDHTSTLLIYSDQSSTLFYTYKEGMEEINFQKPLSKAVFPTLNVIEKVDFVKSILWKLENDMLNITVEGIEGNGIRDTILKKHGFRYYNIFSCHPMFFWIELTSLQDISSLKKSLPAILFKQIMADYFGEEEFQSMTEEDVEQAFSDETLFLALNARNLKRAEELVNKIYDDLLPYW